VVWKAWAFFKRDLMTDVSYKVSFALEALDILLGVAAFYFLGRYLSHRLSTSEGFFPFVLIGVAVNGYMTTALVCFSQGIRDNQLTGTLKAILVTRTSPLVLVLLSSLYPFVRAAVDATVYLLAGIALGVSLGGVNVAAALLVFAFSLLAFSSIGIVSATFTLVFKRGDPVLWLFGGLSWLLGGVFYPVEVLPPLLQHAGQLLPITHALDGMRAALLNATPVAELLPQIEVLALFVLVGLPLSLGGFSLAMRRARVAGTLGPW
jgi:ABC-2 type transport system permease protein